MKPPPTKTHTNLQPPTKTYKSSSSKNSNLLCLNLSSLHFR